METKNVSVPFTIINLECTITVNCNIFQKLGGLTADRRTKGRMEVIITTAKAAVHM